MTPQPKTKRRRPSPLDNPTSSATVALSTRILNRAFDDFGDRDPIEDYVEVSARVRFEDGEW